MNGIYEITFSSFDILVENETLPCLFAESNLVLT